MAWQDEVLTQEVLGPPHRIDLLKVNLAFIETDDLASYPLISEMADELEDVGFEVEFEAALQNLIERVAAMRTHRRARSPPSSRSRRRWSARPALPT